jgi:hypothetical protein
MLRIITKCLSNNLTSPVFSISFHFIVGIHLLPLPSDSLLAVTVGMAGLATTGAINGLNPVFSPRYKHQQLQ